MHYSVGLPTHDVDHVDEFCTADAVAEMSNAAEAAGFDAVNVTDHPFPEDDWLATGGHHALEPLIALSFAGAATRRLRLLTHIYVLPYRNPFLAAKAALSLDVLSGGRLILGVAAGYLEPEFEALGADFAHRNEVLDDAIVAMKAAWTQDHVVFEGRGFRARGNTMRPRPVAHPHPPVWVGGNSARAVRRAVEHGQGWAPFPNPPESAARRRTAPMSSVDAVAARIVEAREHAARIGRTEPLDVCFAPVRFARLGTDRGYGPEVREEIDALAAAGVTWSTIGFGADSRAEWIERAGAFGEEVIAPTR